MHITRCGNVIRLLVHTYDIVLVSGKSRKVYEGVADRIDCQYLVPGTW